jgi:inner membrane protein
MPTILSHPAVTLLKPFFRRLPRGAVAAGAVGSIVPDADVIGFAFHVPYGSTFGHRGFTHSIFFAAMSAVAAAAILRPRKRLLATLAFLFLCTMSHAVLDALTSGGMGVAFFSPFSNRRYFFPWTPIRVSPIGRLSARVLLSELRWVWLPLGVAGAVGWSWLRKDVADVDGQAGEER